MSGIITQNIGRASGLVKSGVAAGAWNKIKTFTSDGSDSDLQFIHGTSDVTFDTTYDQYVFLWNNIHPENQKNFMINFSIDSGSNYNVNKVTTHWGSYHYFSGYNTQARGYSTGRDTNGTGDIYTGDNNVDNGNEDSSSGYMYVYAPGDTTFKKRFLIKANGHTGWGSETWWNSGFLETTSAVDGVIFRFQTGEIQDGSITLYGIT